MASRRRRLGEPRGPRIARALAGLSMLAAAFSPSSALVAQEIETNGARWALWDAVGYGGLGFGAGLLASWDLEGSGFGPPAEALVIIGATTVAGIVGGAALGRRAERSIEQGRPLGGAHRAAAIAGVALAGGAIGALLSALMISPDGAGTLLGSDEQTIALLVMTGTAIGALHAWQQRGALTSTTISVRPAILPGRGAALVLALRSGPPRPDS